MSIISSSIVSQKPAAAADTPMLTPEQLIEELRVLRGKIPEFVQLPNNEELRKIRRAARMDVEFAREAVTAVGTVDLVQSAIGSTPEELRRAEDESARWLSAESELRAVLRGLSAANAIRRYRIARAVQQAYKLSRTLAGQEEFSDLVPHVESMARIRNRKRAKPVAAPAPAEPPKQQ